jgi:hypothetical protein
MFRILLISTIALFLCGCNSTIKQDKIRGANLEMPAKVIGQSDMNELRNLNVDWVATIPYAFIRRNNPSVQFNDDGHWWGEGKAGTAACIVMAHNAGMKVMMKPHVWVSGQGWAGEFEPQTEEDWKVWEDSNREYILSFAKLSDSLNVALFCIGTEYRKASAKRALYWRKLIKEVREVYNGPITYAANWDEYNKVPFWDELDYIGVDAYFPLSDKARPTLEELKTNWNKKTQELETLSKKYGKPVLFTEYGYQSIEYTNSGHWNYDEDTVKTSHDAQMTAYHALFESTWNEEWMAGGFFWKWHFNIAGYKRGRERDYTPQDKPTESVIKDWYRTE